MPFVVAAFFLLSFTSSAADEPKPLTLLEARERALQKHPKISVAELKALVAKEAVREARAGYLPNLSANAGAVGALDRNTRIVAGALTVSSVFDRVSVGVNLSQLVTDFGRTTSLLDSSKLHARAEEQNVAATRAQILLQVDGAYFGALQARALVRVAEETVKTRQLLRDQVSALASNQLRSELDASFAEVGLEEARLLLSKSRNEVESSFATLGALLGSRDAEHYVLAAGPEPADLSADASGLIASALRDRPELQRLRLERESAEKFARAEKSLSYPTLSVQGTAGAIPLRESPLNENYAAAGLVLNVPLFSGGLYSARRSEAELRTKAAGAVLLDEENGVVRDVRLAWLGAANARERLAITHRLLAQARQSYVLAEARYQAGSSSILELSQAQLNRVSAEIGQTSAHYEYLLRRSLLDYQTGALR